MASDIYLSNGQLIDARTGERIAVGNDAASVEAEPQGELTTTTVEGQLGELDTRQAASLQEGPAYLENYTPPIIDDFLNADASAGIYGDHAWLVNADGTGAELSIPVFGPPGSDVRGQFRIGAGTTATGRCALYLYAMNFAEASPEFIAEWRVNIRNGMSNATDTYEVTIGLGNKNNGTEHTSGFYFKADANANANWQCVTANSGTRTEVDSGVALVDGGDDTWVKLRIVSNGAGEITFYIDGTEVATITTTLPGSGDPWSPHAKIVKSAGTNVRTVMLDYFYGKIGVTR